MRVILLIAASLGLTGCANTVTVAGNFTAMLVVLVLLWSTVTMERS